MEKQNITLSIPKQLLKRVRHVAIEKGTSVSALLSGYIEDLVTEDNASRRAAARIKRRVLEGLDLGTAGKATWTREELHER